MIFVLIYSEQVYSTGSASRAHKYHARCFERTRQSRTVFCQQEASRARGRLHIKADEANVVVGHALPFGLKPEVPSDSDVLQDQPLLPPIDIDIGRDNAYSWKALLDILSRKRQRHIDLPPWYRVAISVAGLRTAMLLQDMGIPYEIFEASERAGGRVFTYEFPAKDSQGKHDY